MVMEEALRPASVQKHVYAKLAHQSLRLMELLTHLMVAGKRAAHMRVFKATRGVREAHLHYA